MVEKAKRVQESAPELLDQIERGDLTVNAAAKQLQQPKPSITVDAVVYEDGELRCRRGAEAVSVSFDLPLKALVLADRLEELARKLRKASGPADLNPPALLPASDKGVLSAAEEWEVK
jgi:hypothetical protein